MLKEDLYKYLSIGYEDIGKEDKVIVNGKIIELLETIGNDPEMPHIIFYGKSGVGKKTMINMLLEIVFGKEVYDIDTIQHTINSTDVSINQSRHHLIIEPNNNNFDRHLIKEVVKKYVMQYPINVLEGDKTLKVVQINNLDNLSEYAQDSLRRTIEKYSKTCRFVSFCNSLNKISEPLRSRCLCVHIPEPSNKKMKSILNNIILKENIELDEEIKKDIVEKADGNIKDAIWRLFYYTNNGHFNTIYEIEINKILGEIFGKCNIENVRTCVYNLTVFDMDELKILNDVVYRILKRDMTTEKKIEIVNMVYEFEQKLHGARRHIKIMETIFVGINTIIKNICIQDF